MQVIFSPELFAIQRQGGVTRCMVELMRALAVQGVDWLAWAGRHGSVPLEALAREAAMASRIRGVFSDRLPGRLRGSIANEWGFRRFLRAHPRAVIHRTQYPAWDMAPAGLPVVSTLHDMWTERPGAPAIDRARSHFKRRALERSDAIVAVSEHSRRALAEAWPHLAARAVTIHHGVRRLAGEPVTPPAGRPFFLFVGAREARKNVAILLRTLAAAPRLRDFDLVCVGGGAFGAAEQQLLASIGLGDRVRQREADDAELAGLYEAATAFLYPSIFEGFGLPLLEAMTHGCPVIASHATCLPEIGGDAVAYADPAEPEAWVEAMTRFAFDTVAAADCRRRGADRAARFTWARTAAEHEALYRRLS